MGKRFVFVSTVALMAFGMVAPLHGQEAAASSLEVEMVRWSIITGGFALAFAAAFGALGQGRAVGAAAEGIARNPSAAGDIRFVLILGLVLIESLVIYVLLISLILLFLQPLAGG